MSFLKPTFVSLSPNTEKDDILLACKLFFSLAKEKREDIDRFEREMGDYLGNNNLKSFNSGRSAFSLILHSFGIRKGDEVLIQSFTCNAAVNPIIQREAKPVFVDIDNTLNMDPHDLENKITPKSKAVILQHTFGWPAQIDQIKEVCKKKNLLLIEDAAHSLGSQYKGKLCGTFGDASFFSFGRDKVISSVFGGMSLVKNEDNFEKLNELWQELSLPPKTWTLQQLLHPILANLIVIPSYGLGQYFGKIVIGFFHKTGLLSKSVYKKEKKGLMVNVFPCKMPSSLALLALKQFKKLERFNDHRRKISKIYRENLSSNFFTHVFPERGEKRNPTFLKYPILLKSKTDNLLKKMRKEGIFLNDGWRESPVVPPDTILENVLYVKGSCPKSESVSSRIVNLPTHINISEAKAKKIVKILNNYDGN